MENDTTPRSVYDRLRELYGEELSDEDLGRAAGVPTRTLARWKANGNATQYRRVIEMLTLVGWFNPSGGSELADLERARRVAIRLADEAGQLARLLGQDRAADG